MRRLTWLVAGPGHGVSSPILKGQSVYNYNHLICVSIRTFSYSNEYTQVITQLIYSVSDKNAQV